MIKESNDQQVKLEKIATNLNYLVASRGCKTLAVISDLRSEGKSTFIASVAPTLYTLYAKRILIVDCTDPLDHLYSLLGVETKDSSITKTVFKGIDYISTNKKSNIIGLSDSRDFYDIIFINTDLDSSNPGVLPSIKIDGAILLKSKKSAELKEQVMGEYYSDLDIPVVGVVYNEAR